MTTQGKGLDSHVVPSAIDLHNNNLRLIRMRWVAGAVMLLATVFSVTVLSVPLPTAALIILSLVVLAYNAAIWVITRRAGELRLRSIATAQVAFDWLALALFVHFTGGIESPAIAFFLFHLIMAALLLEERVSNLYAVFVVGVVAAIAGLEAIGWLPHYTVIPALPPELYRNPLYIAAILIFFSVTVGAVIVLVAPIVRELRDRERRLNMLCSTMQALPSSLDLPHVLNQLVVSITRSLEAKGASIRLLDQDRRAVGDRGGVRPEPEVSREGAGRGGPQPDRSGGAARPPDYRGRGHHRSTLAISRRNRGGRHPFHAVRAVDRAARPAGRPARLWLAARFVQ